MAEHRVGRDPDSISPEDFARAVDELTALVSERLPERFWPSEPDWRLAATALVARSVRILGSISLLHSARRPSEALALLRVLYEHAVTLCWVLIDPPHRARLWADDARRWRLVLHREVSRYELGLLDDAEVAEAADAQWLPKIHDRAHEVDEFWSTRSSAFRPATAKGREHLLTMRGLYSGLYRVASRGQHAQVDALDAAVDHTNVPWRVVLDDRGDAALLPLAVPLVGLMLVATSDRLGWPEEERVREISDALVMEP